MGDRDLADLVRRRLFELGITPEEASRRSHGRLPRETIRGLARGDLSAPLSDGFLSTLSRVLRVPEYRARQAAGLPVPDPVDDPTRPHLKLLKGGR